MRPFYETDEDRAGEARVAETLCEIFKCVPYKLKPSIKLDYALVRDNKIVALMEVKCRKYTKESVESMGGLILSADKFKTGMEWAKTYNVPFVIAVKFLDCIRYGIFHKDISPIFQLVLAGRNDRNDDCDTEPCVMIILSNLSKEIPLP